MKLLKPYITIYPMKHMVDCYKVLLKLESNVEYIKFKLDNDKVIISIPTLGDNGKQYKINRAKNKYLWGHISIKNELLRVGKFYIEEDETTEDEIVIYLEDSIED